MYSIKNFLQTIAERGARGQGEWETRGQGEWGTRGRNNNHKKFPAIGNKLFKDFIIVLKIMGYICAVLLLQHACFAIFEYLTINNIKG